MSTLDPFDDLLVKVGDDDVAIGNLLHDFPDAILLVDRDRVIRYWNRGATELFGYAAEEAIGQAFDLLLPEDLRRSDELERLVRRTAENEVVRNHITRRITRSGRTLWVSLTRTPLLDAHGEIVGACAILRDITDLRRAEEEVQRSRSLAMVGELAARVAHEIKNPLAGIYGALQVLRPTVAEEREIFDDMADEIRRLDAIVRDLLRFARPTPIHHQTVCIHDLVTTVTDLLSNEPLLQDVDLRVEGDAEMVHPLDPGLLEQVLINLIQNAAAALDGHTRAIRVRWRRAEDELLLEVEDEGEGMNDEVLAKIFAPFFTTRRGGTGLGLAICRKNVEAHGGRIEVRSEPGRGSCFSIYLPARPT